MFNLFKKKLETKAFFGAGNIQGSSTEHINNRDAKQLIEEGYKRNPIVFRCVDLLAKSIVSLKVDVMVNGDFNDKHPANKLLNNPNIDQSKSEFFIELTSLLLITGNVFVLNPNEEESPLGKEPTMLYNIRPQDITPITDDSKGIIGFKFTNRKRTYMRNPYTGLCGIVQIKEFSGESDVWGQSRLEPASFSVDNFNESLKWNYNLLHNGARPSGVLETKENIDATQYNQLQEQIKTHWEGQKNAGSVKILNGLTYTPVSLNPVDMDFSNSMIMSARYIAQCFGVPAQLIGLPEAQTFNNVAEAKLALYEETIIPLAELIFGALEKWLNTFYKEKIQLKIDLDKISALDIKRKEKMEGTRTLLDSGVITINEARDSLGWDKSEEANTNKLYISAGKIPLDMTGSIDDFTTEDE